MSKVTQRPLLTTVYGSVGGTGKTVSKVVNTEVDLTFKYFQSVNRERVRKVNTETAWDVDLYDWVLAAGSKIRVTSHTLEELGRIDGSLNLNLSVINDLWDVFERNWANSIICLFSLADSEDWCMETSIIKRFNRVSEKYSVPERLPVKQEDAEISLTFKDFQFINRERSRKLNRETAWDKTHWMENTLQKFQEVHNVFMQITNTTNNHSTCYSCLITDLWDIFEENLIDTVTCLFSLADNTGIDAQTSIIERFNEIIKNHGFTELLLAGNQKIGEI